MFVQELPLWAKIAFPFQYLCYCSKKKVEKVEETGVEESIGHRTGGLVVEEGGEREGG